MEQYVLIKKGIKKHFGTLIAITILLFLIFFLLMTAVTIYQNAGAYIKQEMARVGYGDMTVWVSNVNSLNDLKTELEKVSEVERVDIQELIFSGYLVNGTHSDNEGQLLRFGDKDYKILNTNVTDYEKIENIKESEIYISPSMSSSYAIKIGDKIEFELTRNGENKVFTVAGYFEDPFMGSSMIDMKSFLISNQDFEEIANEVSNTSNMEMLARNGAMLHIFQPQESNLSITEFNMRLNSHTNLPNYTEFTYTNETIYGFMMILQNIVIGFLISFVIVLLMVSIIIIAHSISNTINNDRKDLGILKTFGFTNKKLRSIQLIQYTISIAIGIIIAVIVTNFLLEEIAGFMINVIGFIMPTNLSVIPCSMAIGIITIILFAIIIRKTAKIANITPIQAIKGEQENVSHKKVQGEIAKNGLGVSIAIRQLLSGKKRYIGIFTISMLLTFFVLVVGRLDSWLGKNGEGLMNAFSVADYDIGVQPLVHVNMEDVQDIIEKYSDIQTVHALAQQPVSVNGVDYKANIINDSNLFHLLSGKTSENNNEIVVTQNVADALNIKIGDIVNVNYERRFEQFEVVGIYQCANEMGANIGMSQEGFSRIGNVNSYIWCYHFVLSDSTYNEQIMKELQEKYPMQMDVHTNSWSGLDGIVETMHLLIIFMYLVVAIFILIVVGLNSSKILRNEQKDMGIYKAMGFTSRNLRKAFAIRFLIISFLGALIGAILSTIFADKIILSMLRLFGIGEFTSDIGVANTFIPIIMITVLFTVFSYISSRRIKKISLINLIKD